jgi:outer membrane immunogenic protein
MKFPCAALLAATVGIAAPACAADMPLKAAPLAPVYDWSGFYVGGHAGYAWVDPAAVNFNPVAILSGLEFVVSTTTSTPPFSASISERGWLGGLQAGYNWQSQNIVYGFEADVSFPHLKGSASSNFLVNSTFFGDPTDFTGAFAFTHEIKLFGTARGRLGYAVDNWLLYATGGFAWARVESSLVSTNFLSVNSVFPPGLPAGFAAMASTTNTMYGVAIGGGAEVALAPDWWLRGEYLFIDLNSGGRPLSIPGASFTDTKLEINVARLGLSYRFR